MRFSDGRVPGGTAAPASTEDTTGTAPAVPVRRARGQAGISLLESLIAVMLAAVVVLALAGGFLTMMRATDASSNRQRAEGALTSFTESIKVMQYTPCQGASAYQAAYLAWPGRWSPPPSAQVSDLTITDVQYWHPASSGSTAGAYDGICPTPDSGAQRLTVRVKVKGQTVTGQVVIRSVP